MVSKQLTFDFYNDWAPSPNSGLVDPIKAQSPEPDKDSRGAIYTRTEVVDFILDLVGYTSDKPLFKSRLLEPSFGAGDFLIPIISRLIKSWRSQKKPGTDVYDDLCTSIQAVELHDETFQSTHLSVKSFLEQEGIETKSAQRLADTWLFQGDFLLKSLRGKFDFAVGNPPYIRQELIASDLLAEYRLRYQTIYDRADIYIPFIEKSLSILDQGGTLGFICSDRWMKNRYGGPLRSFVADNFNLKFYVDMVDTPAFHTDVIAYPAITIITKEKTTLTRIARRPKIESAALSSLARKLLDKRLPTEIDSIRELDCVTNGPEPWLLESSDQMAIIRRLEQVFPSLEDAGCKVGIGVATGADKAFIGSFNTLDVEPDRKVPLVTTRDIASGKVEWTGLGVVNPFADNGGLVDLEKYPRLSNYLNARRTVIASRHCAQKSPGSWYRTIDRITPSLAQTPKLLIPDIKGESHVVYEEGNLYPHHNLYYVLSNQWDLRALQAVLLSSLTRFFVQAYSTKMRGGFLRFQAQYLRRIRIPQWSNVSDILRTELSAAGSSLDLAKCNQATFKLYNLTQNEISVLGGLDA
jgi:hypothetical protein